MIIRPAAERGRAEHGWLKSRHTFSFADYYDPDHMGYRSLRVINEDRVDPASGFGTHSHRDMEILTYVLEGHLAHRDSMGNSGVIGPGEVQRMTAGTGVAHSEMNPSPDEPVHFLQIWILPGARNLAPGYEQRLFEPSGRRGRLRLIASPDGAEGSLTIHQDATLSGALLSGEDRVHHDVAAGRGGWLQVARGAVTVNGQRLEAGDGAALDGPARFDITATGHDADVLVFDLP